MMPRTIGFHSALIGMMISLTACNLLPAGPTPQGTPSQTPSKPQPGAQTTPPSQSPPAAPSPAVMQTQPLRKAGLVLDILECSRKDGVLTVKVAFRNTTQKAINPTFLNNDLTSYVVANGRKYFVLADSEGTLLTGGPVIEPIEPGASVGWWAKFPAPPAEIKLMSYFALNANPFEDLAITDRK